MKITLVVLLAIATCAFITPQTNFSEATATAKAKHQLILLNFSGSDWCGPCMRMHKEILGSDAFSKMADTSLVYVNADFPRKKKNQLAPALKKQNEDLAEKYNPNGDFPLTVLITPEGNVVKKWEGLPNENAAAFTNQVKMLCDNFNKQ